jgi:antitoxin MazE
MQTTIAKWGNSQALRIPKAVINQLHINTGDKVDINTHNKQIIITPIITEKNTLDELLAVMPNEYQANEVLDDVSWNEVL